MKVSTHQLTSTLEDLPPASIAEDEVNLVIVHGSPFSLEDPTLLENLRAGFPNASIAGCSSAGDILNGKNCENSVIYAAIKFEHTAVRQVRVDLPEEGRNELEAGRELGEKLQGDGLKQILLFSEGLAVDCDYLLEGMKEVLGADVAIFGGLAGDIFTVEHTLVMDREGVSGNAVVAVGLYGDRLEVQTSTSLFDQEGVEIEITASEDNILKEINGRPAFDVYEELLQEQGEMDATSCLHFPIIILDPETRKPLCCRSIPEGYADDKSLLAAGSIPEGPAKLVSFLNKEHLLEDVRRTCERIRGESADFAMIASCIGRRSALGDDWLDEAISIRQTLGDVPNLGFYSFGEIGAGYHSQSSIVHNQTLSIAAFHET